MIRIPCIIEIDESLLLGDISDELLEQFKVKICTSFNEAKTPANDAGSKPVAKAEIKPQSAADGMRICAYCSKPFTNSGKNQRFCSVKCRTLNYSQSKTAKEAHAPSQKAVDNGWYKKKLQEQAIAEAETQELNSTRCLSKIDWELVRKSKKHHDNITIIQ
jgi:hypothetical protein